MRVQWNLFKVDTNRSTKKCPLYRSVPFIESLPKTTKDSMSMTKMNKRAIWSTYWHNRCPIIIKASLVITKANLHIDANKNFKKKNKHKY